MIRYADSFERYDTKNMGLEWDYRAGASTECAINDKSLKFYECRHSGTGNPLPFGSTGGVWKRFDAQRTWYISYRFINCLGYLAFAKDGENLQWVLSKNTSDTAPFVFHKSDGTVIAQTVNSYAKGLSGHMQIKVTVGRTDGEIHMKLDDETILHVTGIDTQSTENNTADIIGLGSPDGLARGGGGSSSDRHRVYDLVISDAQGTANNDFLGVVKVKPFFPQSNGSSVQLTPSSGLNYSCVSRTPPSESYYVSGVSGTDLYGIGADTFTEETVYIRGIQVTANAKGEDTETSAKLVVKSGETQETSESRIIQPTVYKMHNAVFETDPATTEAWTKAAAIGAEYGVEVV